MINYPQMKLGKAPVKKDKRNLKLAKYLLSKNLPTLPSDYYYSKDIPDNSWGMMANDTVGDCTVAAAGHAIMSVTDDNKKIYYPSTADIIGAYSAVSGYVPGEPWTDNGAACLDVLNYWRQKVYLEERLQDLPRLICITLMKLSMHFIYLGLFILVQLYLFLVKANKINGLLDLI